MLYLFSFFKSLQFFGALAVPFYLQRLEFTYTQMFLLETIFSVCLFLFEIPTGIVADKWGRKISLSIGALLFGGGFIVFGFTYSLAVLVLMEIVTACGFSLTSGADRALLYENAKMRGKSDEQAAVIAARYDAFSTAGMLIAFPVGSFFVSSGIMPYKDALGVVFIFTGICTIISGILVLFVKEAPIKQKKQESALQHGVEGFKYIFKNPVLRSFSLNYAIISALTFLMFWFYQTLLLEHNVPVAWNGIIAAAFNGTAMILLLSTGFIRKKLGTDNALFLSSLIPGILYLIIAIFPKPLILAIIAIFGITMLRIFRSPLLITLMNTQISNDNRATVLSGVSMLERIIIAIFYPIAGFLMDISSRWTYLLVGVATVVMAITCFNIQRRTNNHL